MSEFNKYAICVGIGAFLNGWIYDNIHLRDALHTRWV